MDENPVQYNGAVTGRRTVRGCEHNTERTFERRTLIVETFFKDPNSKGMFDLGSYNHLQIPFLFLNCPHGCDPIRIRLTGVDEDIKL